MVFLRRFLLLLFSLCSFSIVVFSSPHPSTLSTSLVICFFAMMVKERECYCSFTDRFGFLQVREAQLAQYNYILVVGEEEANTGQVLPIH